jgi:putative FmdB family regulatory protein
MIYEYKCSCGEIFEVTKAAKDYDKPENCPKCGLGPAVRHYAGKAPPVHFKGDGWYHTTHGGKNPGNK